MKHLSVEQIIDFVSFNELTESALENSVVVNSHIRGCEECRKKVNAFQDVYDELMKISCVSEAKKNLYKIISDNESLELGKIVTDEVIAEIAAIESESLFEVQK